MKTATYDYKELKIIIKELMIKIGNKDCLIAKLDEAIKCTNLKNCQHEQHVKKLEECISELKAETCKIRSSLTRVLQERATCEEELCLKTEKIKHLHIELCRLKSDREHSSKEAWI